MCEPAEKRARTTAEGTTASALMKITVEKMSGDAQNILEVASDSTLGDLRERIRKAEPCGNANVVLHLNGDVLDNGEDSRSLADCGINDGATLSLVSVESAKAVFKEEVIMGNIDQKCKRIYTNDHDQFKTAWFFHESQQSRRVYLVGLEEHYYFEVNSTCNFTVPCDTHGREILERNQGNFRALYGIGHNGGQIFGEPGCFSKSLDFGFDGCGMCPWLAKINFESWGFTVSSENCPGEDGDLAYRQGWRDDEDDDGEDGEPAEDEEVVAKLRENGEQEERSVVAGIVKSVCASMEEEDGKCLKKALEKNGYQPKEVLRKWALAALRAYDETFPQTDPFKWRDWSWEDFRLPNDEEDAGDLLEDRDAPSSPDSDEGKQSSKAESDVNEDDDNGGEDDEGSDNANGDEEVNE